MGIFLRLVFFCALWGTRFVFRGFWGSEWDGVCILFGEWLGIVIIFVLDVKVSVFIL